MAQAIRMEKDNGEQFVGLVMDEAEAGVLVRLLGNHIRGVYGRPNRDRLSRLWGVLRDIFPDDHLDYLRTIGPRAFIEIEE